MKLTRHKNRKKYELTDDTVTTSDGSTLHRIRAIRSFGGIKAGQLGGFVESEKNLSHDKTAWIDNDAKVSGDARVFDQAKVLGNAQVFGDAWVFGKAQVFGDAQVFEAAEVYGKAKVYDNAQVFGKVWVFETAEVFGKAKVLDDARVFGKAKVSGDDQIKDDILLDGRGGEAEQVLRVGAADRRSSRKTKPRPGRELDDSQETRSASEVAEEQSDVDASAPRHAETPEQPAEAQGEPPPTLIDNTIVKTLSPRRDGVQKR